MSKNRLNICDYWGCREPIAPGEETNEEMRFCEEHLKELNDLIDNSEDIIPFWVKASGGAERMENTPIGHYQSHDLANTEGSNG